jgi:hypothetical protein
VPPDNALMETIDDLDFDETNLPGPMRHLVPYYRLYAFSDDAIRERLIQEATPAQLSELVQTFTPLWPDVNGFLDLDSHSNEEVLTHALAQAVMEAEIELKHR